MKMDSKFVGLLQKVVQKRKNVRVVVFTCGVGRIWEKVLEREGLNNVAVLGGGRLDDGYVLTQPVEAALSSWLKKKRNIRVCALLSKEELRELLLNFTRRGQGKGKSKAGKV